MKDSLVWAGIILVVSAMGPAAWAQDSKPQTSPATPPATGTFLERTTLQADGPRVITHGDQLPERYFGPGERSRWIVTNRYLPADRLSFSKVDQLACMPDGTLFVAAGGLVSASESGRPPQGNRVWYADDGAGVWRVEPDGRVTGFVLRDPLKKPGAQWSTTGCNVNVAQSIITPRNWGGLAVSPGGDVYASEPEYHVIIKLRRDGHVEHVAGGGANACARDPWKNTKKPGYQDGPGQQALFKSPHGLAFDREGNLLVADTGNCALRRIDPGGNVTTIRKGCAVDPADEGKPERYVNYQFVVTDPQGRPVVGGSRVYPSRNIYSNIHRLHPDGRVEQLLSAVKGYANSGRLGVEYLTGLAYLPDETLLLTDDANNLVRKLSGGHLSDWIGAHGDGQDIDVDGPAAQARVRRPGGLCATADGTVFIKGVELYMPLRRVDGKTRAVSTWLY